MGTQIFRNEDDFIAYLDTLWATHTWGHRYQPRCLRDEEPSRYPCIMLTAGERELDSGQDEIQNIFLYDAEIHEGLHEEDEA